MHKQSTMPESSKDQRAERDNRLQVPLTDDEKTEIRVRAARQDKSMAEYAREQLFSEPEAIPA